MFDFGSANREQSKAISTVDGPLLIIAGPGTGKTFTLVQRTIYLISERGVKPEEIFIATFTDKAAKELITRVTNELKKRNITINLKDMYIGTFHSLCLRILQDNIEYTDLQKNARVIDEFEQYYTVYRNLDDFFEIDGIDNVFFKREDFKNSKDIAYAVNRFNEELFDASHMETSRDLRVATFGKIIKVYQDILKEDNILDFASIQRKTYDLLKNTPDVLKKLQEKIKYLMVDEYQDTNNIQEKISFLLAGKSQNLCVVGDDDQGLYRFRGATIKNILEFPNKFRGKRCKIVALTKNYRSTSGIIDFYNEWMKDLDRSTNVDVPKKWGHYRHNKVIESTRTDNLGCSSVIEVMGDDIGYENEEAKLLELIKNLKDRGQIKNYNQVAFLFTSVKKARVKYFANYLEENGIKVYSPRSEMFFNRDEIRLAIGCLIALFPQYTNDLYHDIFKKADDPLPKAYVYLKGCFDYARRLLNENGYTKLLEWIRSTRNTHKLLDGNLDYGYTDLLYRMFGYSPFKEILNSDMNDGIYNLRSVRNLSKLTNIVGQYEYLHNIKVINSNWVRHNTERLFNIYIRLLLDGGLNEYEDDSEYAPSGCVSFLTIHQAKGMEFPIVVVDPLRSTVVIKKDKKGNVIPPKETFQDVVEKIINPFPYEPKQDARFFDFWRLFYTAFSRAQDLLIFAYTEEHNYWGYQVAPSHLFGSLYERMSYYENCVEDLSKLKFNEVKNVNIKPVFSFTSHINVYNTCPLQYKFYKELEFLPEKTNAMLFGTLVHETLEDIHKTIIEKGAKYINEFNVKLWFDRNYDSLSKKEHEYLGRKQKEAALKQIMDYVRSKPYKWDTIESAETDISLVQSDYILEGKIDLVKKEGDCLEIVDFKSEAKPDLSKKNPTLEKYKNQLNVYAYLLEKKTGKKVLGTQIYYTGKNEDGVPMVSFPYDPKAIKKTIATFDDTVSKIVNKDFSGKAKNKKTCDSCDFRSYCNHIDEDIEF